MTTEANLEVRARRHAALGEPARLAIVDALVVGDASPGELAALTRQPSNLVAHHLGVLEQAGLIRRVRSEGDRRRSYVQLRLDVPDVAVMVGSPAPRPVAARVVFVCTRNSARSQLAAAEWARVSGVPVASAGTDPAGEVHPLAVATAARHALAISNTTRSLSAVVADDDLLVAVCDTAHENLATTSSPATRSSPTTRSWLHWSVPDPVPVGTDAAFESAYLGISRRVGRLADAMRDR